MAALLLTASACSQGELHLLVDADTGVRNDAFQLTIETPNQSSQFDVLGGQDWPVRDVYHAPDGTTGSILIRATGAGDVDIATRRVEYTFDSNRRSLSVWLTNACLQLGTDCSASETCDACGRCIPPAVEASTLSLVGDPDDEGPPECEGLDDDVDRALPGPGDGPEGDAEDPTSTPPEGNSPVDPEEEDGDSPNAPENDSSNGDGPDTTALPVTVGFADAAPLLVASGSCVRIGLVREPATGGAGAWTIAALNGDAEAVGSWHDDAECDGEAPGPWDTNGGARDVYFRVPDNARDGKEETLTLAVGEGASRVERTLTLRQRAVQVSRGREFACSLLSNGEIHCQGEAEFGRLGRDAKRVVALPARASSLFALADDGLLSSSGNVSCALSDGAVGCFGRGPSLGNGTSSSSHQFAIPEGMGSEVISVDAGAWHGCAVKQDHSVWCWGRGNACSSSGNVHETPIQLTEFPGTPVQCATGNDFVCVRTEEGQVHCRGSLGGTDSSPMALGGHTALQLWGDETTACALVRAGDRDQLYCWREGGSSSPLGGLPRGAIRDVALAAQASCVIVGENLYCWGHNLDRTLGTDRGEHPLLEPTRVNLPAGVVEDVAIGWNDGLALSAIVDGLVYSWGYVGHGTLGLGSLVPITEATPVDALGELVPQSLTVGEHAACIVADGVPHCWGSGNELGNGGQGRQNGALALQAVPLPGVGTQILDVELTSRIGFAISGDETVYAWGDGFLGQLGDGHPNTDEAWSPITATAITELGIAQVVGDLFRSCGRTSQGAVYCWGDWGSPVRTPQLVAEADPNITDVAVWDGGGCLLRDGAVQCWDIRDFTLTAREDLLDGVIDIDGQNSTLCSLIGEDRSAQCAYTAGWETATEVFDGGVQSLHAGWRFACALMQDATVQCAGDNEFGQLGNGSTASPGFIARAAQVQGLVGEVTAFDTGHLVSCAYDSEGLKCWGFNERNLLSNTPWVHSTPTLLPGWR